MKVIDRLSKVDFESPSYSFEFYPPKTPKGVANLLKRLGEMKSLNPGWVDVTWGSGGSTAESTLEICEGASKLGLDVLMHLTCTNLKSDDPCKSVDEALRAARDAGVENILALRGDKVQGTDDCCEVKDDADKGELRFKYAIDLVRYIKAHPEFKDCFSIGVAGYPEGHIENPDKNDDMKRLVEKVNAGADFVVSQMFFDVDLFMDWVARCRGAGIFCPLVPGLLIPLSLAGFQKMTRLCQTVVPYHVSHMLEETASAEDPEEEFKEVVTRVVADMARELRRLGELANEPFNIHFYVLNQDKPVRRVLEALGWDPVEDDDAASVETKPVHGSRSLAETLIYSAAATAAAATSVAALGSEDCSA